MRVGYLTGERVSLRAMVAADKDVAAAWFDSPFPINAVRAEAWLKEAHARGGPSSTLHYLITQTADDTVVGGATLVTDRRIARLTLTIASWLPDADALRAAALRVLYPWLRDDLELMTFMLRIPADQSETIAAAEELGMKAGVRLRGAIARPGHRVDELIYQALFQAWTVRDA